MRFPLSLSASIFKHLVKNGLKGVGRFPLVLMLEPTHRCNLECAGCDRIRLYENGRTGDLTLDECLGAAVECGAPVVTVTGGEPFLYKEIDGLISGLLRLGKHVYLCSNGILAGPFIERFSPHPRLTLNFHFDGMEETHDRIVCKKGTFEKAVASIKKAKEKGFRVSTNTSVFRNTQTRELDELFSFLTGLGVDGLLVSPAFNYERVEGDIFLSKDEARARFREMDFFRKYPFMGSPVYLDFLSGRRELNCTPWGNPTRNPLGWKSPCYLITDKYYGSFNEMMKRTEWERYGSGADPRCADCMVHSGFEATVVRRSSSSLKDMLRLLLWNLRGS